ncbi:MAG: ABC transporter substrate-binding protein [Nitrososphaeria archaeon]
MKTKYLYFLVPLLILGFSVSPAVAQSPMLLPTQVHTHGPLINTLIFNVYSSDQNAFLALTSGQIQAMEWSLTPSMYTTALTTPGVYANVTPSYAFDGIAFNMLMYPYSNVHFRRAIADLVDYSYLQSLYGVAAVAEPYLYNPTLFSPPYASTYWFDNQLPYPYSYNLTAAMQELEMVPGIEYNPVTGQWTLYGKPFSPVLYYRSDDPLRTDLAIALYNAAQKINLTITLKPVTGVTASSVIYSPAAGVVISEGTMLSNFSTTPPVFNMTLANQIDTWGMYTFGWIVSWMPNYPWFFFNGQLAGIVNFGNFWNESMDYWTDILYWAATNVSVAQHAAWMVQEIFYQQLPYVIGLWSNQIYADYVKGWTGFAQIPTTGPNEETGLYYTALNVHPSNAPYGGTFTEALHSAPTSLNPLYVTNWVWQVDVWQEVYDSPLGTPPWGVTNGSLIPWMGTFSVQYDVTAPLGSGNGWWNPFNASKIVNGEIITINFWKNDTWQDGVPLTAYDFNFSLWYWNVQGLSGASTPNAYASTPPFGLLATYIPPNNPYEIQLYVNSTNLWNIYTLNIPVIPMHIFKYFNPSVVAGSTSAMDTTVPLAKISGLSSYLYSPSETLPEWMYWLPNLEVGSGPFVFQSWNKVTNVITLTKNPNYYRSAWWAWMTSVSQGTSAPFKVNIMEEIYNPTSSTFEGVAPGSTGYIPITNATGVVEVINPASGYVYESVPLTSVGNGSYTASIPTSSLSPGTYELMVNATYTSFGLSRVWYSYSGLTVTPVTAVTIPFKVVAANGTPIAGATVTIAGISATTNSSGIAVLANVPLGTQTVTVSATGFKPYNTTLSVTPSLAGVLQTATLSPVPPPPKPSYTGYYIAAAVIIIVVIIAVVAWALRRKK